MKWNTSGVISPGHHKKYVSTKLPSWKLCVVHPSIFTQLKSLRGTSLYNNPAENFAWYIPLYFPSRKLCVVHSSIFSQIKTLQHKFARLNWNFLPHCTQKVCMLLIVLTYYNSVTCGASTCHEGGERLNSWSKLGHCYLSLLCQIWDIL